MGVNRKIHKNKYKKILKYLHKISNDHYNKIPNLYKFLIDNGCDEDLADRAQSFLSEKWLFPDEKIDEYLLHLSKMLEHMFFELEDVIDKYSDKLHE